MSAVPGPKAIQAVIFDLDGLLIDSERVYSNASNGLLEPFGQRFTWAIKSQMMGKPAREATQTLLDCTKIPIPLDEALLRLRALQDEGFSTVQPLPGALRLLNHLQRNNVPMAIATGSQARNVQLKTRHLRDLMACFPDDELIVTADDRELKSGRGKPEPDVFLIAARRLGITDPSKVLVFEDGLPGVEAARRAGMACVWVPDSELREYRNSTSTTPEADLGASVIVASLEGFEPTDWGLPAYVDTPR